MVATRKIDLAVTGACDGHRSFAPVDAYVHGPLTSRWWIDMINMYRAAGRKRRIPSVGAICPVVRVWKWGGIGGAAASR